MHFLSAFGSHALIFDAASAKLESLKIYVIGYCKYFSITLEWISLIHFIH